MHSVVQDLRYAFRMLRKAPGFTAVALITLALGIGANTAIFSVVDAVLLRPLPYHDPDRLVIVMELAPGGSSMSVAYPNYLDWKAQNQVFENLAAYNSWGVVLQGAQSTERLSAWIVTAGFLPTLGVPVARGRGFSEEDERAASQVVVLSDGFWKRRFGGDPGAINTQITIDGKSYTVIGVLPPGFRPYFTYSTPPDVLLPFAVSVAAEPKQWMNRTNHAGTSVVARLKPGVSIERARADMKAIAARLEKEYPNTNAGNSARVESVLDDVAGEIRPALLILLAAAAMVLLIACTNLANLQLARGTARMRDLAVRIALGARRARLIRQLLTESVLLAVIGGALGVLLALWCVNVIVKFNPRDLPRLDALAVNGRVLAFTAGLSVLTGILFGLLPAWQSSGLKAYESLKEAGRGAGLARSGNRVRSGLIIGEVALSLLLLISAGLLIRSFARLRTISPGFNPRGVLTFRVLPPEERYPDAERRLQFYEAVLQRVRALPGVEAAAGITPLPLSGSGWQQDYRAEGQPLPDNGQFPNTDVHFVFPEYFRVMQIPLVRGRLLNDGDRRGSQPVVVINETMARRLWPGQDPLGRYIRTGGPDDLTSGTPAGEKENPWRAVVGVVGDVRQYGLERVPKTEVYFPLAQRPGYVQTFTLRSGVALHSLAEPIRQAIREVDPQAPVFRFATMGEIVSGSLDARRFAMALMASFAGLALLLAAVGIYGVISYAVSQRRHEIGVRMALGARRTDILRMVLVQSARLMASGVILGLLASVFATAVLRAQLFGIARHDPGTIAAVAALLCGIALLASYIPARRAADVDPMMALRYE